MWLDEIAIYLRSLHISGIDQAVFVHAMPAEVKPAVMVAVGYQGMPVDPEIPGFFKGRIQAVSRGLKSINAEEYAQAVSNALTINETTVGSIFVKYIRPVHLPVPFPRSGGDYYEASVNFDICFLSDMA